MNKYGELIKVLSENSKKGQIKKNIIYAEYNIYHNSVDVYTYAGYFLRINCNRAEEKLRTTPCSECVIKALAIDKPLEYADVDRCRRFTGIVLKCKD